MDIEYVKNHSGEKLASKFLLNFVNENEIDNENLELLCLYLFGRFKEKWYHLYKSLELYDKFNPLDNVSEISEHIFEKTGTEKDNGGYTDTIGEQTNTTINDISGFNNSNYVPSDKQTNINGSQVNNTSNNNTTTFNIVEKTTVNRHGNIGVTTSGQLINDYRGVVSWDFYKEVFKDIDSILTLRIY